MLTLAGFETLQLVKLSKMWSLWLGRSSVFGNTPSILVGTQGYFKLVATPFLYMETGPPEGGMHSRVRSGEALLHQ